MGASHSSSHHHGVAASRFLTSFLYYGCSTDKKYMVGLLQRVPWEVIREAASEAGEKDDEGWTQWERAVLDRLEIVE